MEILDNELIRRAILLLLLNSLGSSLLGVFLVLNRYSSLISSLSHFAFLGVSLSLVFSLPLYITLPLVTLLGATFTVYSSRRERLPRDAVINLLYTLGIGLSLLILSLKGGVSSELFSYLFGSVLLNTYGDLLYSFLSSSVSLIFTLYFFKDLVLLSLSEELFKVYSNKGFLPYLFVGVASLSLTASIKVLGIILASSLFIIPPLFGLSLGSSLKSSLVLSFLFSLTSNLLGFFLSLTFDLPPSACIVATMTLFFLLFNHTKGK